VIDFDLDRHGGKSRLAMMDERVSIKSALGAAIADLAIAAFGLLRGFAPRNDGGE